jgi:hypothetical protein
MPMNSPGRTASSICRKHEGCWIPAFAGMTHLGVFQQPARQSEINKVIKYMWNVNTILGYNAKSKQQTAKC